MKIKNLMNYLFQVFPKKNKIFKDYIGFQFGNKNNEITNVLTCLDLEKDTLDFAIKNNVNLIITHHPFFFGKPKKIMASSNFKKTIYETATKHSITVYSFHTNFDNSELGMNPAILKKFNFETVIFSKKFPCLAIGHLLKETPINDFVNQFKTVYGYKNVLLLNYGKKKIKTVGLIGGGGADFVFSSSKENIDLYISGDVPHHVRRGIMQEGLNYLDVPHEIENAFIDQMKYIINKQYPELKVLTYFEKYFLETK